MEASIVSFLLMGYALPSIGDVDLGLHGLGGCGCGLLAQGGEGGGAVLSLGVFMAKAEYGKHEDSSH
jgi:hypothetical protein